MKSARGAAACEASDVNDGANGRLAFGDPHSAVSVSHLPLDDGRTQKAFGAVVRGLDSTRIGEEDHELSASAANFCREIAG